jgi:hypothetical protein
MFCTSEENPKAQKKVYECKILIRKPLATHKEKSIVVKKWFNRAKFYCEKHKVTFSVELDFSKTGNLYIDGLFSATEADQKRSKCTSTARVF